MFCFAWLVISDCVLSFSLVSLVLSLLSFCQGIGHCSTLWHLLLRKPLGSLQFIRLSLTFPFQFPKRFSLVSSLSFVSCLLSSLSLSLLSSSHLIPSRLVSSSSRSITTIPFLLAKINIKFALFFYPLLFAHCAACTASS